MELWRHFRNTHTTHVYHIPRILVHFSYVPLCTHILHVYICSYVCSYVYNEEYTEYPQNTRISRPPHCSVRENMSYSTHNSFDGNDWDYGWESFKLSGYHVPRILVCARMCHIPLTTHSMEMNESIDENLFSCLCITSPAFVRAKMSHIPLTTLWMDTWLRQLYCLRQYIMGWLRLVGSLKLQVSFAQ